MVIANFEGAGLDIPAGEILATTQVGLTDGDQLEADQVVWIKI